MRTKEEKMVSLLVQLQGRGVATGAKSSDRSDPAMDYLMKTLSPARAPRMPEGGGGRKNPLACAMQPAPPQKAPKPNPLSKVLGCK